jgi:hypothetical protein
MGLSSHEARGSHHEEVFSELIAVVHVGLPMDGRGLILLLRLWPCRIHGEDRLGLRIVRVGHHASAIKAMKEVFRLPISTSKYFVLR